MLAYDHHLSNPVIGSTGHAQCNIWSYYLGDQSQFEISNLNGHWINTNNAPLLGFLMPNNGDSWHFRFPQGLLVNMSLLVL